MALNPSTSSNFEQLALKGLIAASASDFACSHFAFIRVLN